MEKVEAASWSHPERTPEPMVKGTPVPGDLENLAGEWH